MIDKKLLRKFLDGQCTAEEAARIHLFLADSRSDLSMVNELLDESWEGSEGEQVDAAQSNRIITGLRGSLYPTIPAVLLSLRWQWIRYAAAAVLLFAIGTGTVLMLRNAAVRETATVEWKTFANSGAKTMYALLPDSSGVWLSPGSTLQYNPDFSRGQRLVRLDGEAFFDVAHREAQPFTVYSGGMTTRVLGTAFNVEAYPRETTVRVSLVRGKVSVQDSLTATALQAGEMLTYDKQRKAVTKEMLKMTDFGDWTKGYTVFNDVPVAVALQRVAARYHKKLELGDQAILQERRVTTYFRDENMEEMLDLLLFVTQHHYRDDGHTITILKN